MFFARGEAPVFSAAERQYAVIFPYGWQDTDDVTIQLPAGFQLEKAENPGDLSFGPPGGYKLSMAAGKGQLICKRELTFGKEGYIAFGREVYPQLKKIFDEVHNRDQVTLSLRQAAAPAGGAQ